MIVGVIIDVMIRQNDAYESEEMQALGKILRRIESVEKNVNTVKSNLGAEPYPIKDDSESQTAIDLEEKDDEI